MNHMLFEALNEGRWQPHYDLISSPDGNVKATFVSQSGQTVEAVSRSQQQAIGDLTEKLKILALNGEIEP